MRVLVTGGTGLIGRHLVPQLLNRGYSVILFCRSLSKAKKIYGDQVQYVLRLTEVMEPLDAVINLAGEPIMDRRWSRKRKQQLRSSRIGLTRHLVKWLAKSGQQPKVFISGSAIGYYGNHPEEIALDETAKTRECFPSQLCNEWEFEALKAKALGVRVCMVRTGVVLDRHAGALKKMWQPFSMGLGGRVGSGKQWLSWVHIDDMVRLLLFLFDTPSVEGPVNATAPEPVVYDDFTRTFAKHLRRPHLLPMPTPLLKLLFGESAQLLYEGQRVTPKALLDAGFHFEFDSIDKALADITQRCPQPVYC